MKKPDFRELILRETPDYIIVNKPPFLASLDDRNDTWNLLGLAREYEPDAQLCHRLDKDTSGVLVIARNPDAYRNVAVQLEHRKVMKEYHAVSEGTHDFREEYIDLSLRIASNGEVRANKKGKPALTVAQTRTAYRRHTLVSCFPITGRMHQIRVHLSAMQAPILGDLTYGGKLLYLSELKRNFNLKKGTEEQPLIKRHALHARRISFEDLAGKTIEIEAPYPKDFTVLIKQLNKFN